MPSWSRGGRRGADGPSRESRQDRARAAKTKAAQDRKTKADRGRKTDEAIRNDPDRRHPW